MKRKNSIKSTKSSSNASPLVAKKPRVDPPVIGNYSTLSDKAILRYYQNGSVRIEPFKLENLSTSSYDVCLGENYYRASRPNPIATPYAAICDDSCGTIQRVSIYNPYSETSVGTTWGKPFKAQRVMKDQLENVPENTQVIFIAPGETILAHTEEFIGGINTVTTMLKARSSYGRSFIEVCKCAGWGDIGYINRWTLEITNNSQHYHIPLVVGMRIAQIVFFDTEGTIDGHGYEKTGKYQSDTTLEELVTKWQPSNMLPRLYMDRELTKN